MERRVALIFFLLCVFGVGNLIPEAINQQMSSLHREIGSNLIHIKKQHPAVQSVVFAILDQLGKYHAISRKLSKQKKKYKTRCEKAEERCTSLKKKVVTLESKIEKMKKLVVDASDRLQRDSSAIRHFNEEKLRFEQEREEFAKEKEEFENAKKQMLEEVDVKERLAQNEKNSHL